MTDKEKRLITSYLNEGGYVLEFTNDSFRRFIIESIDIDPYEEYGQISKGKLLTEIYLDDIGDNKLFRLTSDILEEIERLKSLEEEKEEFYFTDNEKINSQKYIKSYEKKIEVLTNILEKNSTDLSININMAVMTYTNIHELKKTVEECFRDNQYLNGLDRLHTLFHSYLIEICKTYDIEFHKKGNEKDRYSMDSLYNKVVNYFISKDAITSDVTVIILQSSKPMMKAFNDARNNHSKSHPTEQWILENEARYINGIVINTIQLMDTIMRNIR